MDFSSSYSVIRTKDRFYLDRQVNAGQKMHLSGAERESLNINAYFYNPRLSRKCWRELVEMPWFKFSEGTKDRESIDPHVAKNTKDLKNRVSKFEPSIL